MSFVTYTVTCPVGQKQQNIPYSRYVAIIFDTVKHTTFTAVFRGTNIILGCVGSNYGGINNDGVVLRDGSVLFIRESSAGDYILSVSPIVEK